MRSFEKVAIVFAVMGALADCFDAVGARLLLLVAWVMLAGLYLFFTPSLLRGRVLPFTRKNTEKPPLYSRILAVGSGFSLALLASVVLALWQLLEQGFLLFFFALLFTIIIALQSFSYWKKKEVSVHIALLSRLFPFLFIAIVLFFLPTDTKLWLKTRDPILRSLALRAIESPENEQAQSDLLYYQQTGKLPAEIAPVVLPE
jgi:hypothetical protein